MAYGRRGMAIIAPIMKLVAYIVISVHPPYPAVVAILAMAGFGNGLLDGAWNAWVGAMDHPNQILGLLHACYGAGATISPSIATAMVTKYDLGWWQFYYLMAGLMVAELIVCAATFWDETGAVYKQKSRNDNDDKGMTRRALQKRTTWVAAAFLLIYMGVEGTSCRSPLRFPHSIQLIFFRRELILFNNSIDWRLHRHIHDPSPPR